jgi:hypothetical protein
MPPDVQPVTLADEPVVVFIMVGLFAAAAILAVLFATPLFSRVPRVRMDDESPHHRTPWSASVFDD